MSFPASIHPVMHEEDWRMRSAPVLAIAKGGEPMVVRLEQSDEDLPPQWYTTCSEHWCLGTDGIERWTPISLT
ncbi:hypothetical protein G3A43_09145 [Paraburkholderia aspalathi]|nr:hypothetical protein [Paraburkholderia aspalathi]MBK3780405.1 hypothetical protein [Paraburkholderia aspalathi]